MSDELSSLTTGLLSNLLQTADDFVPTEDEQKQLRALAEMYAKKVLECLTYPAGSLERQNAERDIEHLRAQSEMLMDTFIIVHSREVVTKVLDLLKNFALSALNTVTLGIGGKL